MSPSHAKEMPKAWDPKGVEERWYRFWLEHDLFRADPGRPGPAFSIVIPPPNVTGVLHIGHALDNALQDIVARRKRMQGWNALWLPGTDHAGIATQNVVEKALAREGRSRHDLGRADFVERVWEWKAEHGGRIVEQLRKLGCSCDWSRERFTLDEGLSRAVREVFCRLYEEGLLYRGSYIVQWCVRCRTAISDLEVEREETRGSLWQIRYPLVDGGHLAVATTRPETMLGDTALAVHPEDERFKPLVGKLAVLPIVGRRIPIIADSFVDPAFGTGIVKVTPAHDPNDFEMGRRHGLEEIQVIGFDGRMTEAAGVDFAGLDRFDARTRVIERLEAEGLLEDRKDHLHAVGRCQRCETVVEPLVSLQWFVKIAPLAEPAIRAVEDGRVEFVPPSWSKVYLEWMRNIRDWCISRQLWWGHRIPVWTCPQGHLTVARTDPDRCGTCGSTAIEQDPDVLDTWFSSQLWPFSTMGWPEKTPELARYYPTSVLVTAWDIIFFWVARMIMAGLHFTGEVPFRQTFIHGLVRDRMNQKMSKSAGNAVDPIELMDLYGTDAVRFTLAILCTGAPDLPFDWDPEKKESQRILGYRAFCNKLWNAARFVRMNLGEAPPAVDLAAEREAGRLALADRWILSRLQRTTAEVNDALEAYRFYEAAQSLYHFLWGEYCDWYIELSKQDLQSGGERGEIVRAVLLHVLDSTLRLLHPIMPFLTEEIWQALPRPAGSPISIAVASYPERDAPFEDPEAEREVEFLIEAVTKARNLRAEAGVDPRKQVPVLHVGTSDPWRLASLRRCESAIRATARIDALAIHENEDLPAVGPGFRGVIPHVSLFLPTVDLADAGEERARFTRELKGVEKDLAAHQAKLANPEFLSRAPATVVEKTRGIVCDLLAKKEKLGEALGRLKP